MTSTRRGSWPRTSSSSSSPPPNVPRPRLELVSSPQTSSSPEEDHAAAVAALEWARVRFGAVVRHVIHLDGRLEHERQAARARIDRCVNADRCPPGHWPLLERLDDMPRSQY